MKINLQTIFKLQSILDQQIHKKHHASYFKNIFDLKLALHVELAECANEIRSFKFWSYKPASDDDIILGEYVDGIHFITSLGIYYHIDHLFNIPQQKKFINNCQITKYLIKLFSTINKINNKEHCYEWYKKFLIFGFKLGFKLNKIISKYKIKCQINHQRLKNNY